LSPETAVGHEKAQKAQRKEGCALAESFTGSMTVSEGFRYI